MKTKNSRKCSKEDCCQKHFAKGLCRKHYRKLPYVRQQEKEYNKEYREEHLGELLAKGASYREINKEKLNERKRMHYWENPEEARQRCRDWKASNEEQIKTYSYYRGRTNKGRYSSLCNGAKSRGWNVEITFEQYSEWRQAQKQCSYCNGALPETGSAVDRIRPTEGYSLPNMTACCKQCNITKNTKTVKEFEEYVTNLYENFQRKASQPK